MAEVISTKNYEGTKITCSNNQWYGHIVKNHGKMSNNKEAIIETIESPDMVYESADYAERNVYFKKAASATYSPKFMTKVIVEYDIVEHQKEGKIVTAFPVKEMKGGIGDVIYQK